MNVQDVSAVRRVPQRAARVAVVEPVGGHGGMDFSNHALCSALAAEGWMPLLLTSQAMKYTAASYTTWEVYRGVFGAAPKWRRGIRHVVATVSGLYRARRMGVKVAHFHVFHVGLLQYFGLLLGRLLGMRIVLSAHDVGSFRAGESHRILTLSYRASDAIIAHSDRGRIMLTDTFGVPGSKVFAVPLGNYEGFLPPLPNDTASKRSFGFNADDFVVLFFGQIKRVKRLDLLLAATALARRNGAAKIRLLVAGSAADSDMDALRRLIEDEGLVDIVQLHACYIGNEDLPRYFAAADLCALPYDNIFQSGVILLAMSNDVPVLTSDIPGMLEIVEHGRTGLTFRAGDVEDLADRLIEASRGSWDMISLAEGARDVVRTRHGWANCARISIDAYTFAIGATRSRKEVVDDRVAY